MKSSKRTTFVKSSGHAIVPSSLSLVSKTRSEISWSKAIVNSFSSSASQTYKKFDFIKGLINESALI